MKTRQTTSFLLNCLLIGWSVAAAAEPTKAPPAATTAPAAAPTTAKSAPPVAATPPAPAKASAPAAGAVPAAAKSPAVLPAPAPAAAAVPVKATPVAAPAAAPLGAPAPATIAAPAAAAIPAAVAPGQAAAAAPSAPATALGPKPAPELDQLKVLEGNWRCDGRAPASASAPEHAYRSTWKFKRDLDNFWWAAEYSQSKAKANPVPLKARGYLTWDPNNKAFVLVGVDNMGGSSTETTSGWSGDVVTLAGDANVGGKKIPYREVITKKGTREFTWRGEMKMGGDWVTLGEDRCKK